MPRDSLDMLVTFPDRDQRLQEFVRQCRPLQGQYELTARPRRLTLSQKQRGYYHGHVVEVFAEHLEGTGQPLPLYDDGALMFETWHDYAHAILKRRCLAIPVKDRRGNVVDHLTGSTTQLDTAGMSLFTERARKYLWDRFELETMNPDPGWARDAERLRLNRERRAALRESKRLALPAPTAA
jgi:hypothetical protein